MSVTTEQLEREVNTHAADYIRMLNDGNTTIEQLQTDVRFYEETFDAEDLEDCVLYHAIKQALQVA